MKKERLMYEAPRARDLSAVSASGQDPLGACWSGTTPFSDCSAGDIFTGQDCSEGTFPTYGTACTAGPTPAGGCFGGTNPGGARCTPLGSQAQMSCFDGNSA